MKLDFDAPPPPWMMGYTIGALSQLWLPKGTPLWLHLLALAVALACAVAYVFWRRDWMRRNRK